MFLKQYNHIFSEDLNIAHKSYGLLFKLFSLFIFVLFEVWKNITYI